MKTIRKSGRTTLALLFLLFCLLLSGCSDATEASKPTEGSGAAAGSSRELHIEDILRVALEKNQDVSSFAGSFRMSADMTLDNQRATFDLQMDIEAMQEPLAIKAAVKLDMGEEMAALMGGTSNYTLYMEALDDETATVYIDMGGVPMKQTMSLDEMNLSAENMGVNLIDSVDLYLDGTYDTELIGEETEGERKLYHIRASLSEDALSDLMQQSFDGLNTTLDMDEVDQDELAKMLKEMKVDFWLDAESGRFFRMDVDMTEVMQKVLALAGESAGDATIHKTTMSMTVDQVNTVEQIEIPASLKGD